MSKIVNDSTLFILMLRGKKWITTGPSPPHLPESVKSYCWNSSRVASSSEQNCPWWYQPQRITLVLYSSFSGATLHRMFASAFWSSSARCHLLVHNSASSIKEPTLWTHTVRKTLLLSKNNLWGTYCKKHYKVIMTGVLLFFLQVVFQLSSCEKRRTAGAENHHPV